MTWTVAWYGHDNDMDNDLETEPKTRQNLSAMEPVEVNEPRENATEPWETSSYTTRSGKRVINQLQYDE